MTIQKHLLVTTNSLEEYFVDKTTGLPLAAGIVYVYKDSARATYKNWYYQVSGSPPDYTYEALPNPLTLSAVGTIVDDNGNDVTPFYFPWNEDSNTERENYYIVVKSSTGVQQFAREGFPFDPGSETPDSESNFWFNNLIINGAFWRAGRPDSTFDSSGTITTTLTNVTNTATSFQGPLCPGAHVGLSMPGLNFFKNTTGATETCKFVKFPNGTPSFTPTTSNNRNVQPEYYLKHSCTVASGGGETYKFYQMPIMLHISNLQLLTYTFSIEARANTGSPTISISILQFTGSSLSAVAAPVTVSTQNFTLNSSWAKKTFQSIFPSANGVALSGTGDDAFYLQISLPTNATMDIDIALPSIYLGNQAPANYFQTYDQISAVIDSPHTGDFRNSLNFNMQGWVPANDGSIGNTGSAANVRACIDTWPLYKLIYDNVTNVFAPVSGGRSGSAYTDFIAAKTLTLTSTLGRVIAGQNPMIPSTSFSFDFAISNDTLVVASSSVFFDGSPVQITAGTVPDTMTGNTVYYVYIVDATHIALTDTEENAKANMNAISFGNAGTGTLQFALGATAGQSKTSDVPQHTHPFSTSEETLVFASPASVATPAGGPDLERAVMTGTTGLNTSAVDSINLLQPTVFMNVYIKL